MKKTQVEVPENIIDLGLGHPSLSLLPHGQLGPAAAALLSGQDNSFLQYGPDEGGGRFRQTLAEFLSRAAGVSVEPDNLFMTGGNSLGIDLACASFTRPGDTVIVEEPTYFYAFDIFRNHRVKLLSVPMDEEGMDVRALERLLKRIRPAMVYTIPFFHNPMSCSLAEERRRMLIRLCEKHGFVIASDEAYQFLPFRKPPSQSLASLAPGSPVLSLGSFSKILGPGLRLGWIQARPELVERLASTGFVRSGGGLNPFTGEIVAEFIRSGGQERHIAILREEYGIRAKALCAALRHWPQGTSFIEPEGGFFVWVRLPGRFTAAELKDRAESSGVRFKPGSVFSLKGEFRQHIRLSLSYYGATELELAVRRMGNLMDHGMPGDDVRS
jgi:2-aminoadipate transaminase